MHETLVASEKRRMEDLILLRPGGTRIHIKKRISELNMKGGEGLAFDGCVNDCEKTKMKKKASNGVGYY